jgi:hypothetical protein
MSGPHLPNRRIPVTLHLHRETVRLMDEIACQMGVSRDMAIEIMAILGMAGQMGMNGYPKVAGELNGYAELLIRATGGRMERTTRKLTPVDEARADAQRQDCCSALEEPDEHPSNCSGPRPPPCASA